MRRIVQWRRLSSRGRGNWSSRGHLYYRRRSPKQNPEGAQEIWMSVGAGVDTAPGHAPLAVLPPPFAAGVDLTPHQNEVATTKHAPSPPQQPRSVTNAGISYHPEPGVDVAPRYPPTSSIPLPPQPYLHFHHVLAHKAKADRRLPGLPPQQDRAPRSTPDDPDLPPNSTSGDVRLAHAHDLGHSSDIVDTKGSQTHPSHGHDQGHGNVLLTVTVTVITATAIENDPVTEIMRDMTATVNVMKTRKLGFGRKKSCVNGGD